ncbi:MAG TPA: hypothetical protein PKZ07_19295 [Sedimentisphaerales bacterium]|nr:hypothetical protein [Sedimentisphaerales bacterium]
MSDDVLDDDSDEAAERGGAPAAIDDDDDPTIKGDRSENIDPPLDPKALKAIAGDDDSEEEAEEGETTGSKMVPHGRFHAVNEAKKALEEQNAELVRQLDALRSGTQQPATAKKEDLEPGLDVDDLEAKYIDAVFVGDHETARALRHQINDHILASAEAKATARAQQEFSVRDQQTALSLVAEQAFEEYPFLNDKSKHANKEAIADVVDLRDVYVSRGESAAKALKMAVAKIGPLYAPKDEPQADDDLAQQRKARQADAIRRGAEASAKQPPTLRGVGERESNLKRIDVESMSEEEYEALPSGERKRLRGF